MSISRITLNQQVIRVLCAGIFAETVLLSTLQSKYASSGWDDTLLTSILNQGSKEGRYLKVAVNPNYWQLRYDMVLVNGVNRIYQSSCARIKTVYFCGDGASVV